MRRDPDRRRRVERPSPARRSPGRFCAERFGPDDILVIRSTLPVGGTRRSIEAAGLPTARVFTNPEFLRQGTAIEDFVHPTRIVIGRFPDADARALDRGRRALRLDRGTASHRRHRGGRDHQERRERVPCPQAVVHQRDRIAVRGGRRRRRRGPRRDRRSIRGSGAPTCSRASVSAGAACPRSSSRWRWRVARSACRCTSRRLPPRQIWRPRTASRSASPTPSAASDGRTIALLGLAFKAGTDDIRDSPAIGWPRVSSPAGATVRGLRSGGSLERRGTRPGTRGRR